MLPRCDVSMKIWRERIKLIIISLHWQLPAPWVPLLFCQRSKSCHVSPLVMATIIRHYLSCVKLNIKRKELKQKNKKTSQKSNFKSI